MKFVLKDFLEVIFSFMHADSCPLAWRELMTQCWNEQEGRRPSFNKVVSLLQEIGGGKIPSLVDSMISLLEKQTEKLEKVVRER